MGKAMRNVAWVVVLIVIVFIAGRAYEKSDAEEGIGRYYLNLADQYDHIDRVEKCFAQACGRMLFNSRWYPGKKLRQEWRDTYSSEDK